MTAIYRKRGAVVRWENGTLVRVSESGVASEEGETFTCHPEPSPSLREAEGPPPIDPTRVLAAAAAIESLIAPPSRIERLIVSEGLADHECDGRQWGERSERIHLSLVRQNVRAMVDLGSFELGDVRTIAAALARFEGEEQTAPRQLRLAPNVAAALLRSLPGLVPLNVTLWQTGGGIDGKGRPIEEVRIEREPWPNWYRPSYRSRPVRMPLDLRLECAVMEIDRHLPIAVALLAPADGLMLRVLVDDGMRSYPALVRIARIEAVARERTWYPYGGGALGAEIML